MRFVRHFEIELDLGELGYQICEVGYLVDLDRGSGQYSIMPISIESDMIKKSPLAGLDEKKEKKLAKLCRDDYEIFVLEGKT